MASKLLGNTPKVLRTNYYDGLNSSLAQDILNSPDSNRKSFTSSHTDSANQLATLLS